VARYQSWESCGEREALDFIREIRSSEPGTPGEWFQFAVELKETGQLIGDCGLKVEEDGRQAEIGVTLSREHQGKGYAFEAVSQLLDYAFVVLKLHRVVAIADQENAPSVALLERLGMYREGSFAQNAWFKGRWTSEYLYAILRDRWLRRKRARSRANLAPETFTLRERPELADQVVRLSEEGWPSFLLHGDMTHWDTLFDEFAELQVLFCEPADTVVAVGHTIPFVWDGTPDDLPTKMAGLMDRGVGAHRNRETPNTLSALAALVRSSHRGRGLSAEILRSMRSLAKERGLRSFVAPVRPTLKSSYPLTPFERYVGWRRDDGAPFDPWLRVHHRLGAEFVRIMPRSLVVTGTVSEWEEWTGMVFPESGPYVVPGALQPMLVDLERDEGRYEEPNVWMRHPVP
jgi:RimJ/RimL family protein N-acetyltransferase